MTTHIYNGTSISVQKRLTVLPGESADLAGKEIKLGLGTKLLTFTGWTPAEVASTWNATNDVLLRDITAVVSGEGVAFTHNVAGQDFELTVLVNNVEAAFVSEIHTITFLHTPSGGTFTLTFAGQTTGNITYVPGNKATTAANILAALEALSNIQVGDVQVTDVSATVFTLDWSLGQYAGVDVELVEADYSNLTGGDATVVVTTLQNGNPGTNEIQKISAPGYSTFEDEVNEIQSISMSSSVDGGTFDLTIPGKGTALNLPYNINRSGLRAALKTLLGANNYKVTGSQLPEGTLTIEFIGSLSGVDIPTMFIDSSNLTASTDPAVLITQIQDGQEAGVDPSITITTVQNGNVLTPNIAITTTQNGAVSSGNNTVQSALYPLTYKTAFEDPDEEYYTFVTSGSGSLIGWDSVTDRHTMTFLKFFLNPTAVQRWVDVGGVVTAGQTLAFSAPNFQFPRAGGSDKTQIEVRGTPPNTLTSAGGPFTATKIDIDPSAAVNSWNVTALLQEMLDNGYITPANTNCVLAFIGVPGPGMPGGGTTSDSMNIGAANDKSLSIVYPLPGTDEIQKVTVTNAQGGSFKLSVTGTPTASINYGATAGAVQTIIRAIINDAVVTGGPVGTSPVTVTFPSTHGNLAQMTVDTDALQGLVAAVEQHKIVVDNAVGGSATFVINGFVTDSVDYNMSASQIKAVFEQVVPGINVTGGPIGTSPVFIYFPGSMGNVPDSSVALNSFTGLPEVAEIQDVRITGSVPQGGTVTLTLDGDALDALPYNATALQAQNAAQEFKAGAVCTGGPWPLTIRFSIPGSFGNLAPMTESNTLVGVEPQGIVGVTQEGGLQEVGTITGGTFSLGIKKTGGGNPLLWVTGIPWNTSASELETRINAKLGANSVSCTGGPLPGEDITINFDDEAYEFMPMDPTALGLELIGNFGGQIIRTTEREAKVPRRVDHVWDFTVIPGYGTLAVDGSASSEFNYMTINFKTAEKGVVQTGRFRWVYMTPLRLQLFINELFGKDVCRVTQTAHSLEWGEFNQNYGESDATTYKYWYYRDSFRVVFINDYDDPDTIEEITVSFPPGNDEERDADCRDWMVSPASSPSEDYDDLTKESTRVFNAFVAARLANDPVELFQWNRANPADQELRYRFKLLSHYLQTAATGSQDGSGNPSVSSIESIVARSFTSDMIPDLKVRFLWKRSTVSDPYLVGTQSADAEQNQGSTLATTPWMDWDSPSDTFQYALQNLLVGVGGKFFGDDNVTVEGSLRNSWMSEGYEAAEDVDSYTDLQVTLVGKLARLPFNEMQYMLCMEVLFDLQESDPEYAKPAVWKDVLSVPVPPLRSERQRIVIEEPEFEGEFSIGVNGTFVPVTLDESAQSIEDKLNAFLGKFPIFDPGVMPVKWSKAVTVLGVNLTQGLDFEFNGYGYQYQNFPDLQSNLFPEDDVLIMTIETVQDGILRQPEIQRVAVTGRPWTGQFRLVHSGNQTALLDRDATAPEVQAALVALPSLGALSVVASGGPLMDDDEDATQGPITLTFAQSLNNVAQLTVTGSTLRNAAIETEETSKGGKAGSLTVVETVRGNGPNFYDCPDNWSNGAVPGSLSTVVVDDARAAILFGVRQRTRFSLDGIGVDSRLAFGQNRRTFLDGQLVYVRALTGSLPGNLDEGYYYIAQSSPFLTFKLSLPDDIENPTEDTGVLVEFNSPGVAGNWIAEVRDVEFVQYSRFGGKQIGLPKRRTAQAGELEYLAQYLEMGFTKITLGVDEGDGLNIGRFNTGDLPSEIIVDRTGGSSDVSVPAVVFLSNSYETTLVQNDGQVGVAVYADDTSKLFSFLVNGGEIVIGNLDMSSDPDAFYRVLPGATHRFLNLTVNGVKATLSN